MNTFWLKIAGIVVVIVVVIIVVDKILPSGDEPKTERKAFYDVIAEDDRRLRAEPEAEQRPVEEQVTEVERPAKPESKEIALEDQVQAERLFEMALAQRKMGRLPGVSYKLMVDYCREIIEKYPNSPQAPKARRMLGEVPRRYWKQYNITEEEVNPAD